MDTLDTFVRQVEIEGERHAEVVLAVNGRELRDLVREVERPFAEAEGHPGIAGSYIGIWPALAFLPSGHLFGELEPDWSWNHDPPLVAVLICDSCGEADCWPLCAHIDVLDDVVVWRDFENPWRRGEHGLAPWRYDGLGPFRFDRAAYERALVAPDACELQRVRVDALLERRGVGRRRLLGLRERLGDLLHRPRP